MSVLQDQQATTQNSLLELERVHNTGLEGLHEHFEELRNRQRSTESHDDIQQILHVISHDVKSMNASQMENSNRLRILEARRCPAVIEIERMLAEAKDTQSRAHTTIEGSVNAWKKAIVEHTNDMSLLPAEVRGNVQGLVEGLVAEQKQFGDRLEEGLEGVTLKHDDSLEIMYHSIAQLRATVDEQSETIIQLTTQLSQLRLVSATSTSTEPDEERAQQDDGGQTLEVSFLPASAPPSNIVPPAFSSQGLAMVATALVNKPTILSSGGVSAPTAPIASEKVKSTANEQAPEVSAVTAKPIAVQEPYEPPYPKLGTSIQRSTRQGAAQRQTRKSAPARTRRSPLRKILPRLARLVEQLEPNTNYLDTSSPHTRSGSDAFRSSSNTAASDPSESPPGVQSGCEWSSSKWSSSNTNSDSVDTHVQQVSPPLCNSPRPSQPHTPPLSRLPAQEHLDANSSTKAGGMVPHTASIDSPQKQGNDASAVAGPLGLSNKHSTLSKEDSNSLSSSAVSGSNDCNPSSNNATHESAERSEGVRGRSQQPSPNMESTIIETHIQRVDLQHSSNPHSLSEHKEQPATPEEVSHQQGVSSFYDHPRPEDPELHSLCADFDKICLICSTDRHVDSAAGNGACCNTSRSAAGTLSTLPQGEEPAVPATGACDQIQLHHELATEPSKMKAGSRCIVDSGSATYTSIVAGKTRALADHLRPSNEVTGKNSKHPAFTTGTTSTHVIPEMSLGTPKSDDSIVDPLGRAATSVPSGSQAATAPDLMGKSADTKLRSTSSHSSEVLPAKQLAPPTSKAQFIAPTAASAPCMAGLQAASSRVIASNFGPVSYTTSKPMFATAEMSSRSASNTATSSAGSRALSSLGTSKTEKSDTSGHTSSQVSVTRPDSHADMKSQNADADPSMAAEPSNETQIPAKGTMSADSAASSIPTPVVPQTQQPTVKRATLKGSRWNSENADHCMDEPEPASDTMSAGSAAPSRPTPVVPQTQQPTTNRATLGGSKWSPTAASTDVQAPARDTLSTGSPASSRPAPVVSQTQQPTTERATLGGSKWSPENTADCKDEPKPSPADSTRSREGAGPRTRTRPRRRYQPREADH